MGSQYVTSNGDNGRRGFQGGKPLERAATKSRLSLSKQRIVAIPSAVNFLAVSPVNCFGYILPVPATGPSLLTPPLPSHPAIQASRSAGTRRAKMSSKIEAMRPQRKIEMFSGTYFAACTLGGIVGEHISERPAKLHLFTLQCSLRANTYSRHAPRPRKAISCNYSQFILEQANLVLCDRHMRRTCS